MTAWLPLLCAFLAPALPGDAASADRRRAPDWLDTARVFLLDAYQYPFSPRLEFDADKTAETMARLGFNTIRFPAIGMYATIPGLRFPVFPGQGDRDLLAEMLAAAKRRGIRVVVYLGTGHKLAWSIVTKHYPEYGQRTRPGGLPDRTHFFVGEDFGTVCWNTPYRAAYFDMLTRVVRDYDIDAVYFDRWTPQYFWPGLKVCYCEGCRRGFRAATGEELPYRERREDYTDRELNTIRRYHDWYRSLIVEILEQAHKIVRSHKDIPLIANINNPQLYATEDRRLLAPMDAFLYERSASLLERAEGVSLIRAAGLRVWPYIGSYHNWPRVAEAGYDYSQEIYTTVAFGGSPIVAQPTGYLLHTENERFIREPFALLAQHEDDFKGFENVPYVAVVWSDRNPPGHARSGRWFQADARSATRGAFAACLHRHFQVSSVSERLLDDPAALARYRVLYLADVTHLTQSQADNVRAFVRNGGGLVVSYATGLYDGQGSRAGRFAFEDLIRVRPAPTTDELTELVHVYSTNLGGPNDLYLLLRDGITELPARWRGRLVPLWYFEPVATLDGAKVLMDIVTGDGSRPVLPGVVFSQYGKGRVLYCASSLESLYDGTREQVLADLIRDFVLAVSPEPPPFEIEGPASVVANLRFRGGRRVLHLVNWSGGTPEARYGSYYHLPVVENLRIRVGQLVKQVHGYPQKIATRRRGATTEFVLPRLGGYQAICWEQ